MKKKVVVAFILIVALLMSACGKVDVEPVPPEENTTEQSTLEPQETQEQADEKPSPEGIINNVLTDAEKVFEETSDDLKANNGENIGTEYDRREVGDEGVRFIAPDGTNPFMPLSKRLNEVDGITDNNQAFYMKFKPSAKNFGFMLSSGVNVGINIGGESEPVLFIMDHDYTEALDTDLRIEPDNWYNVLLAVGGDGLIQGAIWKDGEEDGAAYINLHIRDSFGDDRYANQSWQVDVGFQGEATFTVDRYAYYTFSNFVMGDRVLDMGNDNQNNMPQNKDDVLYTMLWNPRELWGEGGYGFAENGGGEFGAALNKVYNADEQRLEIYGEDTGDCVKFNTSLKTCMTDVGMEPVPQQAVIVRFSSSDISNGARISFDAKDEIDFWFGDDGLNFVDVARFFQIPITDFMPNNLEFKDDTIYCFFFAFNQEGNIRMFIWEEGNAENQGYFEYDLYQDEEDINSSDLIMHLGIGANSQFNLYEYWVFTFESFMDGVPPYVMSGAAKTETCRETTMTMAHPGQSILPETSISSAIWFGRAWKAGRLK